MTYLALDVGSRRIGVAVGSTDLRLATPVCVISRGSIQFDADRLKALAREYDVEKFIIGLPREVNGEIGAQARSVLEYSEELGKRLEIPFEMFDERYSTAEALAHRREVGISDKRGRPTIDAAAAAVILQDFFDARH